MELKLQNLLKKYSNVKPETEEEKNLLNQYYILERNMNKLKVIEKFKDMKEKDSKYSDRITIKELIEIITELPTEDEYNMGCKYPYPACEMLIKADKKIQEMIFFSEEDFNSLYNTENKNMNKENENEIKNVLNNKIIEKNEINKPNEDYEDKNEKIRNEKEEEIKEKRKFNIDKHNDILDTLFDFTLNEDSLSNDVLCGYFYKVISFLMENYLIDIFLYLFFVRKDALEQIVMHSYKRPFALISVKILNVEDNISKIIENDKKNPGMIDMEFLKVKKAFIRDYSMALLENVLTSIDLDGMKDKSGKYLKDIDVENIIFIFKELVKTGFNKTLYWNRKINNHLFKIFETTPTNEKNKKIYNYFIIMLTEILHNSRPVYQNYRKIYPEFDYNNIFINIKGNYQLYLAELVIIYIPKILSTNFIESSKEKELGIHIIYLMDLVIEFLKYFKDKPNVFDFIILQSGFMEKSINYFFEYQLNNIYQSKFVTLFTLYLEEATNHPLLTDFIFNKINFPLTLTYFIYKLPFKKKDVHEYNNKYQYKSGKKMLSCVNVYVMDLLFKIKLACECTLLDKEEKVEINMPNYNFFEFLKDENTTKKSIQFKLPKYIADSLCMDKEWSQTIKKYVIPKIKKFEGKLLCNGPIKPKPNVDNSDKLSEVENGQNSLRENISDKNMKNEEESFNNFNDIIFWKMKNDITKEIKEKVESKINKNNDNIDEEDELLSIAIELEKKKIEI